MNKINMIMIHNALEGIPYKIVDKLYDDQVMDNCIVESFIPDSIYEKKYDGLLVFNTADGWNLNYEKYCDYEKMPPLDKHILEALLPYESMAIKTGIRRTGFPITLYEDEKRNYLKHVRFWNYMFDKKKINFCYFSVVPHNQHDYVIYALAKVKMIPTLVYTPSTIPYQYVGGSSISKIGECIEQDYNSIILGKEEVSLADGPVRDYYNKHRIPYCELKKEINPGKDKGSDELAKKVKRDYWGFDGEWYAPLVFLAQRIRIFVAAVVKYKNLDHYRKYIIELSKKQNAIEFYKKHNMVTLKQYNLLAEKVDYSRKYIYFALQLTPEETTIPRAGVFADQYTSIQLLASCAKKYGVYVYVKEHYVQAFRSREFYDDLRKISNVSLIKTTESTYEIINNSIAVATQTGSCILEGVLWGKPALVFGDGYTWKSMPGVFVIRDYDQGCQIINLIMDNYEIDQSLVKKYFAAIQKNVIDYSYLYPESPNADDDCLREKSYHEVVRQIENACLQ